LGIITTGTAERSARHPTARNRSRFGFTDFDSDSAFPWHAKCANAHAPHEDSYRAVLQTTEGQLFITRERLRPQSSPWGQAATLRLSAARLTSDSYKLTLQGKAADAIEIARDYYFKVGRK
jgi:hypothetical protein